MAETIPDYDIIIAGGGPAGVLAATRLSAQDPSLSILLVEKESDIGGRLRTTSPEKHRWAYGLNRVSDRLKDFCDAQLRHDPEGQDLPQFALSKQKEFGVLAAGEIDRIDLEHWFSPKGAKLLGGNPALRDWEHIEPLVAEAFVEEHGEQSVSTVHTAKRNSPAGAVLEHYAHFCGIPDWWSSNVRALAERTRFYSHGLHGARWEDVLNKLLEPCVKHGSVKVETQCRVIGAAFENNLWTLETERGHFNAPKLIVAQSPWEAALWLPRSLWPSKLLSIATKTKPVSAVTLSEELLVANIDLPDVIIVPAEEVQILVNKSLGEVSFQHTIDFELSLQAPDVVKAVKKLKRARRKLLSAFPGCVTEGDHIALVPVAWSQSPHQADRRWFEKLEAKVLNSDHLAFCGDAYGQSYDGDENLVRSILSITETQGASA